jgi:hypothetical protein
MDTQVGSRPDTAEVDLDLSGPSPRPERSSRLMMWGGIVGFALGAVVATMAAATARPVPSTPVPPVPQLAPVTVVADAEENGVEGVWCYLQVGGGDGEFWYVPGRRLCEWELRVDGSFAAVGGHRL